jgi:hypothetical protein
MGVSELLPPHDLALNVALPELRSFSPALRRILGPVYEKFNRGDWREGFEEACLVLETEARNYLKEGIRSTRITILDKRGAPNNPTLTKVGRMTLGQLASVFARIQSQNHTDSLLAGILPKINPDRIGVVHKKRTVAAENRLRKNVGKNMWMLINALKAIK